MMERFHFKFGLPAYTLCAAHNSIKERLGRQWFIWVVEVEDSKGTTGEPRLYWEQNLCYFVRLTYKNVATPVRVPEPVA